MTQESPDNTRKARKSHLRWVRLGDCKVSLHAQGQFRPGHAEKLASRFDLEAVGFPVCSLRDGCYYLIDGQHRVQAALLFGFEPDDKLQMEVYEGLTESEEAELFLERNFVKAKSAWDKYHVAITADRDEESTIDRAVRAQGLSVGAYRGPKVIAAIQPLRTLYRLGGPGLVSRTLRIILESFGDTAFDSPVIHGLGLFLHRYGNQVTDSRLIEQLQKTAGGLNGLMEPSRKLRATMGETLPQCVAAQATSIYNRAGGKKLPPWWKA